MFLAVGDLPLEWGRTTHFIYCLDKKIQFLGFLYRLVFRSILSLLVLIEVMKKTFGSRFCTLFYILKKVFCFWSFFGVIKCRNSCGGTFSCCNLTFPYMPQISGVSRLIFFRVAKLADVFHFSNYDVFVFVLFIHPVVVDCFIY